MACLAFPAQDTVSFDKLLAANPDLQRVSFYRLTCKSHGVFRLLCNGVVPDRCPRCGQPAQLQRARNLQCATQRPVPLVQRWRADNADRRPNTPPAWLRREGEIEDC
jgi:hypothetical protein